MKKNHILLFVSLIHFSIFSQSFTDVSSTAGITHTFAQDQNMGGGVTFFDYDNDGWEDLYITSGYGKDKLYKNLGDGTFNEVTAPWLNITGNYYTVAVVAGDINNDGNKDLFVTTWNTRPNDSGSLARNLLFINNGSGSFTENGLGLGITDVSFSMGTAMLDYNNDGFLDIYVVNYVMTPGFLYDSNGDINGFDHDCFNNLLYRNNGNGTFTEIASSIGVDDNGCALAVMPTDYDQDEDQDLYIANDFGEFIVSNIILENNDPTNSFTDVSLTTNMNIGIYGMGIAYGDYDKDGDFDYYITNLGRNVLINNNGSQNFTDVTTAAGVENTYTPDPPGNLFTTGWGTAFLDVDNDTWQDLFVANGRVPSFNFIATGETDPNKLYKNNGDSTFSDVTAIAGIGDTNRGRGMAYSDYDKDGDLDVFVVVQNGSADINATSKLYRNNLNPNGTDGKNWAQFDLEGIAINRDAIGAKIELTVNGEILIQEVHGQGSHCSQHSLILHFGLAANSVINEVEVIWSKTDTQTFTNISVNTRYFLTQGATLSTRENNFLLNEIKVFPNPIDETFQINISNFIDGFGIEIYTILGQKIFEKAQIKSNDFIDVNSLSKGIYIIKIITSEGSTSKKIVIN